MTSFDSFSTPLRMIRFSYIRFNTRHTLHLFIIFFLSGLAAFSADFDSPEREKMLRDSTIKYGVEIEPYLKKLNGGKIVKDYNYSPAINQFLKKNKYVKFPPYALSIGEDSAYKGGYKRHLSPTSGNRLYFPKGSSLVSPSNMKTNSYMVFLDWTTKDVFIDGINIIGAKAHKDYGTSMYGCGIAMYGAEKIWISNAAVTKSSGDGVAVRVQWKKQSKDIVIHKLNVNDATRVGVLITGVINGTFRDVNIEGTGEEDQSKVVKPQTALSFEPNDCTSKYVNCKFENLHTVNNLGPVVATTNFWNILRKNTCGVNKIDITINNWTDLIDTPAAYGASLSVAGFDKESYANSDVSGKVVINNATITRNTVRPNFNAYFIQGATEKQQAGIVYELNNMKFVSKGKSVNLKTKDSDEKIKTMIDAAHRNSKVKFN